MPPAAAADADAAATRDAALTQRAQTLDARERALSQRETSLALLLKRIADVADAPPAAAPPVAGGGGAAAPPSHDDGADATDDDDAVSRLRRFVSDHRNLFEGVDEAQLTSNAAGFIAAAVGGADAPAASPGTTPGDRGADGGGRAADSSKQCDGKNAGGVRRCATCANCRRKDCGVCVNCKDRPTNGGLGLRKKACEQRRCLRPVHVQFHSSWGRLATSGPPAGVAHSPPPSQPMSHSQPPVPGPASPPPPTTTSGGSVQQGFVWRRAWEPSLGAPGVASNSALSPTAHAQRGLPWMQPVMPHLLIGPPPQQHGWSHVALATADGPLPPPPH